MLDEQVDDALVARVQRVVAGALPAPVDRVPRRACVVGDVAGSGRRALRRLLVPTERAAGRASAGLSLSAAWAARDGHIGRVLDRGARLTRAAGSRRLRGRLPRRA